jgi:hypothetical protein
VNDHRSGSKYSGHSFCWWRYCYILRIRINPFQCILVITYGKDSGVFTNGCRRFVVDYVSTHIRLGTMYSLQVPNELLNSRTLHLRLSSSLTHAERGTYQHFTSLYHHEYGRPINPTTLDPKHFLHQRPGFPPLYHSIPRPRRRSRNGRRLDPRSPSSTRSKRLLFHSGP